MRNTLLFLLVSFSMASTCLGQLGEQYKIFFAFEDAVGNKDTIWMVRNTAFGTDQYIDVYDDEPITTPFDSIFDVRIDRNQKTVVYTEYPQDNGIFFLRAKNKPVKLSWDQAYMLELGSFFGWHYCENDYIDQLDVIVPETIWKCLAEGPSETTLLEFNPNIDPEYYSYQLFEEVYSPEDYAYFGADTIFTSKVIMGSSPNSYEAGYSPCQIPTPNPLKADQMVTASNVALLPNPVTHSFSLRLKNVLPPPSHLRITDLTGKTVFSTPSNNITSQQYDVSSLTAGFYFLNLFWETSHQQAQIKFIKM